jgi:ribosomal protein S27AE
MKITPHSREWYEIRDAVAQLGQGSCPQCSEAGPTIATAEDGVVGLRCRRCHAAWSVDLTGRIER